MAHRPHQINGPVPGSSFQSRQMGSTLLILLLSLLAAVFFQPTQSISRNLSEEQAQAADLEKLWQDLASPNARTAWQSLWKIVDTPKVAIPFLEQRLKEVRPPDQKKLAALIKDLNSEVYTVRARATAELEKMGMRARPALLQVFANPPSPEVYLRVKKLLSHLVWSALPPKELQICRGLEALEYIGSPEARQVLKRLAKGPPENWETQQAQTAWQRLQVHRKFPQLANSIKNFETMEGHTNRVYALAYSPDGKVLASGGADSKVKLWDLHKGELLRSLPQPSGVWSLAFTPDGKTLAAACTDDAIRLWDMATHKLAASLIGHSGVVYCLDISPDGKLLVSGGSDTTVRLWDLLTHQPLATLTGHQATVWSVAFSPDGRTIVSGSSDRTVKLWEVASSGERAMFPGHTEFVRCVAFTPNGKTVLSGDSDGTAKIWSVRTGILQTIATEHAGGIRHLACHPGGKVFGTAGVDSSVKLWDLPAGKAIANLQGHTDKARCVAFSPDGRFLATGSYDMTIKLWKLTEAK